MSQGINLRQSTRYYTLDHWRGVACLLVVVLHSAMPHVHARETEDASPVAEAILQLSHWGVIGVPMFFVISGYCISATAQSTLRRGHPMKMYFTRRLRRIFPPYWFALGFALFMVGTIDYVLYPGLLSSEPFPYPRPWWFLPSHWIGNLTLTESWRFHFFGERLKFMLQPAWTLCYEEQFYIVVGLILLFGRKRFFTSCAIVTLAAFAIQLTKPLFGARIGGFFFDGHWLMFAAGIVVYYHVNHADSKGKWACCGFLALLAAGSAISPELYAAHTAVAVTFALLLIALHRWDHRFKDARLLKPLAVCGTMCYSLYLIHSVPVRSIAKGLHFSGLDTAWETILITLPICLGVSLTLGWIFYLCVERHFLNPPQAARATVDAQNESIHSAVAEPAAEFIETTAEASGA